MPLIYLFRNTATFSGLQMSMISESNQSNTEYNQFSQFCIQLTWWTTVRCSKCKHLFVQMYKCDGYRQAGSWKQPTYLGTALACRKNVGCFQMLHINIHHIYTSALPRSDYISTVWLLYNASAADCPLRTEIKRHIRIYIYIHRVSQEESARFGRVFLMLKYTDITQNTYVQSWTVTEIMAREVWNFDSCYTLIDYQIHIKTGRNMWFL